MQILKSKITIDQLAELSKNHFGDFIKAVIDIDKEVIAIDADLHSDLEAIMLDEESEQINLWGVNYYHSLFQNDFIEYDSMINIKPNQDNNSRYVEDEAIRNKITKITYSWIVAKNV